MDARILRRKDVERLTGLSKATLYRLVNSGAFPRPVKLSPRAVGWHAQVVKAWLESRPVTEPLGGATGSGERP